MQIPFFDLKRQHALIHKELAEAFDVVLQNGNFIQDTKVHEFEALVGDFYEGAHCISTGNGTDALELIFEFLDLEKGSEVILPAFGWLSAALAVHRAGLKPVFCDVDVQYGNLDLFKLEKQITNNTRALVVIHLFGAPGPVDQLKFICHKYGLILIEDCAQAIGTKVNGKLAGSIGDFSTLSFYPTKNLGALGDGGAILTGDESAARKLRAMKNYGRTERKIFEYAGRNTRLDELQAAFLVVKWRYLSSWTSKRRVIAGRYFDALGQYDGMLDGHIYYRFFIRSKNRKEIEKLLSEAGIGFDTMESNLMEHIPYFKEYITESHLVARHLADEIVCLPLFPELTEEEVAYICDFLKTNKNIL